ncbi:MAG: nucleotidyltransferase [Anaerococcus vaginalis]|uniref:nucleotidyltransferase n=1 Tax=Anaerococcus vaginalis TaxID=33037 RepID=UPI0029131E06|nr:nucleotidyltransferase [Anaerococcus vaginalis]
MNTTLVVLAAGIGSRYGQGIKQLAKMDDNGYTIIDYSIYDAIKAGFNKVVFIIRKDIEEDFKEIIGNRIEKIVEVEYAYQDMDLPKGFESPKDRKKPWGTVDGTGVRDYIHVDSLHEFLVTSDKKIDDKLQIAMAGYKLKNTLSDKGAVTRGVSIGNEENKLVDIIETHEIKLEKDGKISSKENLDSDILNLETTVSMNLWASFPEFIDMSEDYFIKYLEKNKENLDSCEYVLPEMIGELIKENKADVTILPTNDKWIGITYKEDLIPAQKSFQKMFDEGLYPDNIWEK